MPGEAGPLPERKPVEAVVALDAETFAQHNGPCLRSVRGRAGVPRHGVLQRGWPLSLSAQKLPEGYVLPTIAFHKDHLHQEGIRRQRSPGP